VPASADNGLAVRPAALTLPLERHCARPEVQVAPARLLTSLVAETELRRPHEMPYDMAVVAEVLVGTPPQALKVLLDTGSGDFWIPSSQARPEDQPRVNHSWHEQANRFLDAQASKTFLAVRGQWSGAKTGNYVVRKIRYGYGQIEAMVVKDTVRFAGVEVPQQSFLLATSQQFPSSHLWDGILGLAFPQPFPAFAGGGQSLLAELGQRGVASVLSFVPGPGGRHAELRIGHGSYEPVSGSGLTWMRSVSDRHWIVDASVAVSKRKAQRMIVDTGTSLILVSAADFMETADALSVGQTCFLDKSGSRIFCSCANISSMPALRLYLGTTTFVLNPEDLFEETGQPLGGGFDGEEACELLMAVTPVHRQEWILGDVFLRKVVTIFDFEQRMVGFAPHRDDPTVRHRTERTGSGLATEVQWTPLRRGGLPASGSRARPARHAPQQDWEASRGPAGPPRTDPARAGNEGPTATGLPLLALLALPAAALLAVALAARRLPGRPSSGMEPLHGDGNVLEE